jgi:hypothetical protein
MSVMRYVVIRYPAHWEIVDCLNNCRPVYETRRLELARRECDRLNREKDLRRNSAGFSGYTA